MSLESIIPDEQLRKRVEGLSRAELLLLVCELSGFEQITEVVVLEAREKNLRARAQMAWNENENIVLPDLDGTLDSNFAFAVAWEKKQSAFERYRNLWDQADQISEGVKRLKIQEAI